VLWLFLSFGIYFIARSMNDASVLNYSPNWMLGHATSMVLYPTVRTLGTITTEQAAYMVPNPLSLGQSLTLLWPYMVGLISLSAICFAISYIVFMKQEVRAS